jgi:uncharacterized repeat protein (TIGR03803 family)
MQDQTAHPKKRSLYYAGINNCGMKMKHQIKLLGLGCVILWLSLTPLGAQLVIPQNPYTFNALTNGITPDGPLTYGAGGFYYGTTYGGGLNNRGSIFKLATNGLLTTLVSFANTNGANPYAGLTLGNDGNFYGTTYGGGSSGRGAIYRVTTNGLLTTLVSFANTNGANPYAGLTLGNDGNFYGTTYNGGSSGRGTIYRVTTNGLLTTLVSFANTNGANPYAGLTLGNDGNFYGTTYNGGLDGYGVYYRVTPAGGLTVLASFTSGNGANPAASLILAGDGNFYGSTVNGGNSDYGILFQASPAGAVNTLYSFSGGDGANPYGSLTVDVDGNLYGTTSQGGDNGYGTTFQCTTNGTVTTLFSFGYTNGSTPLAGLTAGSDGNFYGTASAGGNNGFGVVFTLPRPVSILAQPTNMSVVFGNSAAFGVTAAGGLPFTYQWLVAGAVLAGATNSTLLLPSVNFSQQGSYSVVVANAYSSITSSPALLSVTCPTLTLSPTTLPDAINGSPYSANLSVSGSLPPYQFSWAGGTMPPGIVPFEQTKLQNIANFSSGIGSFPVGQMVVGTNGNLLGTAQNGGAYGHGGVFSVSTGGQLITLLSFVNGG